MHFDKPIAFIDIESTGLDRMNDRIIEISVVKYSAADDIVTKTMRLNPGMSIPEASTKVHGITDEMVKDAHTFRQISKSLHEFIEGCDIGGFGILAFDVPMLYNEFLRASIVWNYQNIRFFDGANIYKQKEPRDLTAALKFYCGVDHEGAHGAEADAIGSMKVLVSQIEKYSDLETMTPADLALYSNYGKAILDLSGKFTYNEEGKIILNFGPHRGLPAEEHLDFVRWMTTKDFPPFRNAGCQ